MTQPILDISEHQLPDAIDYPQLAKAISWVIVRVQYGSLYEDKQYKRHLEQFKRLGVPVNVYAWVRGINEKDMEKEAEDFFQRGQAFQPSFWWLDIEERSMDKMVVGTERYRQRLKQLGAKKVGAYIGNHIFQSFGYTDQAVSFFDGLWLPTYGRNNGVYEGANPTASQGYDLHQYTSNGRLSGYNGPLDLSRLSGTKPAQFFTDSQASNKAYRIGDHVRIHQIFTSSESQVALTPLRNNGTITQILAGKRNPYLLDDGQLGWVNLQSIIGYESANQRRYVVKQGESLWSIGLKLGINWQELARLNQLANPNLIYPNQVLVY